MAGRVPAFRRHDDIVGDRRERGANRLLAFSSGVRVGGVDQAHAGGHRLLHECNVLWRVGQPVRPSPIRTNSISPSRSFAATPGLTVPPDWCAGDVTRRPSPRTVPWPTLRGPRLGARVDDRGSRRPTRSRGLVLLLPDPSSMGRCRWRLPSDWGRRPRASTASITAGWPRRLRYSFR
jgi:hypothetical protein